MKQTDTYHTSIYFLYLSFLIKQAIPAKENSLKKIVTNLHMLVCTTFLSMVLPISLESQNDTYKVDAYTLFDEIVSKANSGIFKGTEYFERYKRTNKRHQYFKTYMFINGSVVYDEQSFFDIPLKYDVFDDKLLVKDPNTLNAPVIELDKDKVTTFTIEDHRFIHLFNQNNNETNGFFEILLENEMLSLYKKHLKDIIRKSDEKVDYLDKQVASYEFKDTYAHVVTYQGFAYKVKKATDLNTIFGDHKKEIKALAKRYKSLRKSDPDAYMKAILTAIYPMIKTQNSLVKS